MSDALITRLIELEVEALIRARIVPAEARIIALEETVANLQALVAASVTPPTVEEVHEDIVEEVSDDLEEAGFTESEAEEIAEEIADESAEAVAEEIAEEMPSADASENLEDIEERADEIERVIEADTAPERGHPLARRVFG